MILTQNSQCNWKVLLIGGNSGVGKTTIANALARDYLLSVLLIDDIRLAIQQVVSRIDLPNLHLLETDQIVDQLTPHGIRDALIHIGRILSPSIEIIIAHHIVVGGVGSLIIEGDNILPHLAIQRRLTGLTHFHDLAIGNEIRAVFLVEPDEGMLLHNLITRGRGFQKLEQAKQRKLARSSWLYGQWLMDEANQYGLPVLEVRPYETLLERIKRTLV